MKIFTAKQIKEIDRLTLEKEPITSFQLMERASMKFTRWFTDRFDSSNPIVVFAGSGNNGGDALAISRMLIERQYPVKVFLLMAGPTMSDDCAANFEKLQGYTKPQILDPGTNDWIPGLNPNDIVIDGIFGTGLNRRVEGTASALIQHINQNSKCTVSIDIPSGLFGEDNRDNNPENIIKASFTVKFEFPLLSFFMSGNNQYTGIWEIIPIGLHKGSIDELQTEYYTIEAPEIKRLILPREKYSHKGTYGHALIIAGRTGMMGAAVLAAKACLRGGTGLLTALIPRGGYDIFQTSVHEALIRESGLEGVFDKLPGLDEFQAIACGPAIGQLTSTAGALLELLKNAKVPLVLDADALTILSKQADWLERLPSGTVITPHPKEFDRLAGASPDMYTRHLKQLEFARRYNVIVILKGAHTIISTPEGRSFINTTGNPGMASGGTGDVLTGLLVSLLAQGYNGLDASLIAVFLHGLAGDIALEASSMEAMIAGDIIENIGKAFRSVKGKG